MYVYYVQNIITITQDIGAVDKYSELTSATGIRESQDRSISGNNMHIGQYW